MRRVMTFSKTVARRGGNGNGLEWCSGSCLNLSHFSSKGERAGLAQASQIVSVESSRTQHLLPHRAQLILLRFAARPRISLSQRRPRDFSRSVGPTAECGLFPENPDMAEF